MKSNRSTRDIQTSHATSSLVQVVKPDIIVFSGIAELDNLLGGFKAGETTLVDGNSSLIEDLPNQLCVNTYRTFHSETIYIDGGMCANPYQIARYARMLELDQQDVLENVAMSRAFTVYQLSTLIHEMLEPMIQKRSPRTLIIGMLPALYLDPRGPRSGGTDITFIGSPEDTRPHRQISVDHSVYQSRCDAALTIPGSGEKTLRMRHRNRKNETVRAWHIS